MTVSEMYEEYLHKQCNKAGKEKLSYVYAVPDATIQAEVDKLTAELELAAREIKELRKIILQDDLADDDFD